LERGTDSRIHRISLGDRHHDSSILTIHKLVSLAALVMIVLTIKQLWTDARVGGLGIAAIVVTLNSKF
jgi:hypothetical protein